VLPDGLELQARRGLEAQDVHPLGVRVERRALEGQPVRPEQQGRGARELDVGGAHGEP
jgi:hypothetical protein